jgi:polyhydroxyalkanoate synthase
MIPNLMRPDQVVREVADYTGKLVEGFSALSEAGEIDVGVTEKEAVYQEDKMVLYRYTPRVKKPAAVPVLIVYALVNRPYMMDLQEDRSTIRGLLDQGLDVYLIDWGYPDGADRYLGLDDYVDGYMHRCVDFIRKRHGLPAINLLGVCQGGTMSLTYAALYPRRVKNLITMVTPVDFHTDDNMLGAWARDLDVDLMVDTLGNVPGEVLNWTFLSLKPFRLTGQKYVDMADVMDDPKRLKNFLRMEKWIFDSPDQAGEMFRQFIRYYYQENRLVKGTLEVAGKPVRLSAVTMPVFNVYALADHLVPPSSSIPLKEHVGTKDYTAYEFKGGHIGIYVSGKSLAIPPAVADWLKERS